MREFALLDHVYSRSAAMPTHVAIGPGDDMGALRIGDALVLVTVDQVADGVHVDLRNTPLAKVARKAITRNLSDVAAMAAVPVGAVVAASLPRDFSQQRANELFDHMRVVAEHYQCPLFGGDISMWDHPLLLTVTVLAEPAGVQPILRSGARVGDGVYVTGRLGGSLLDVRGRCHHLDFEPRLALARQLAQLGISAMIDLSDGLGRDIGHICRMSRVSATLDVTQLPISEAAQLAAAASGKPAWQHALGDGEDYELCFTAAGDMPRELAGVPITRVGSIVAADGEPRLMLTLPDGSQRPASDLGWEHVG